MFKKIAELLHDLNDIQYLNPITHTLTIEGLGDRQFTTTKDIEAESLDEGAIEIYAIYGDADYPTATTKLLVDIKTREVLDADSEIEVDEYLVHHENLALHYDRDNQTRTMYNG